MARSWDVVAADGPAGDAIRRIGLESAIADDDPRFSWQPTTSLVSGSLPLNELPTLTAYADAPPMTLARVVFETSAVGLVRVLLDSSEGLLAWLDGEAVPPGEVMDLTVTPGQHRLTFAIDRHARSTDGLRVVFEDVPGSAARAQPIAAE